MKDEMPQADFSQSSYPNTDQTKKLCYFTEEKKSPSVVAILFLSFRR